MNNIPSIGDNKQNVQTEVSAHSIDNRKIQELGGNIYKGPGWINPKTKLNDQIVAPLFYDPRIDKCVKDRIHPLQGSTPLEKLISQIDTKNLAHFFGDAIIRKSEDAIKKNKIPVLSQDLEGNPSAKSLQFIVSILELIVHESDAQAFTKEEKENLQKAIRYLKDLVDVYNFLQHRDKIDQQSFSKQRSHIQSLIEKLPQGESILLPGGWTGYAGLAHAMVCELVKLSDNTFQMNVYNAGAGINHHSIKVERSKLKVRPCISFRPITLEEIKDTKFLSALLEVQTILPPNKKDKYSDRDLYRAVYGRFDSKLLPIEEEDDVKISTQRSGTCSMRAPMAFLHKFLGTELHKKVFLEGRLRLLEICADLNLSSFNYSDALKELLQFAEDNMSREILKRNTSQPNSTVRSYNRLLNIRAKMPFVFSEIDPIRNFDIPKNPLTHKKDTEVYVKPPLTMMQQPQDTKFVALTAMPQKLSYENPVIAIKSLEEVGQYCKKPSKSSTNSGQEIATEFLVTAILNMPMPVAGVVGSPDLAKDVWQNMNPQQIEQTQKALNTLMQLLIARMIVEKRSNVDRLVALHKLFAITWRMGCLQEASLLQSENPMQSLAYYGVEPSSLKNLKDAIFDLPSSPLVEAQLLQLLKFFKKSHPSPGDTSRTLFDFSSFIKKFSFSAIVQDDEGGTYRYLNAILAEIPEQELKEAKDKYNALEVEDSFKPDYDDWKRAFVWTHPVPSTSSKAFYSLRNAALASILLPPVIDEVKDIKLFSTDEESIQAAINLDVEFKKKGDAYIIDWDANIKSCTERPDQVTNHKLNKDDYTMWELMGRGLIFKRFNNLRLPPFKKFENIFKGYHSAYDNYDLSAQNRVLVEKKDYYPLEEISLRKNLRLYMLIKYFKTHFEDLADVEFQNYFLVNFFSQSVLSDTLAQDPKFANTVLRFFDQGIEEFKLRLARIHSKADEKASIQSGQELASGLLFCAFSKFVFLDYAERSNPSTHLSKSCQDTRKNLRNHLKDWLLFPPPWLKSKQLQAIARCILVTSYSEQEWNDPVLATEIVYQRAKQISDVSNVSALKTIGAWHFMTHVIQRNFARHAEDLIKLCEDPAVKHQICSAMLKAYGVETPSSGTWEGNYPVFSLKNNGHLYKVNIANGNAYCDDHLVVSTRKLFQNDAYRNLFGDSQLVDISVEPAAAHENIFTGMCPQTQDKYKFLCQTQEVPNPDTKILRYINGIEYQYQSWNTSSLQNTLKLPLYPNNENYHCWISTNAAAKGVFVEEKGSRKMVMRVNADGTYSVPEEHGRFDLVDVAKSEEWDRFASIDSSKAVTVMKRHYDNAQQEVYPDHIIIFSRLKDRSGKTLYFKRQLKELKVNGKIESIPVVVWAENPQYYVDSSQNVKGINENPPIVLRDSQGKRKALVPIKCSADFKGAQEAIFSGTIYTCELIDIDAEGNLLPTTPIQSLLAGYRLLREKRYQAAMQMLRKGCKQQAYNAEELQLLGWIFMQSKETKDFKPDAQAVSLYAAWLVHQNTRQYPQTFTGTQDLYWDKNTKESGFYYQSHQWKGFWLDKTKWTNTDPEDDGEDKTCSEFIAQAYHDYCQVSAHVHPELRLDNNTRKLANAFSNYAISPIQELDWLLAIQKNAFTPFVAERIKQLANGTKGKTYRLPTAHNSPKVVIEELHIKNWFADTKNTMSLDEILDSIPRIRPGKALKNYYGELYRLAKKATPEDKKKILLFLNDMQFEKDQSNQAFSIILKAICTDASAKSSNDTKDPQTQLLEIVEKFGTQSMPEMSDLKRALSQCQLFEELSMNLKSSLKENLSNLSKCQIDEIPETLIPQLPLKRSEIMTLTMTVDEDRNTFNTTLFNEYFKENKKNNSHGSMWDLTQKVGKEEFVVDRHKEVVKGFEAGCSENDKEVRYCFNQGKNLETLCNIVKTKFEKKKTQVDEIKKEIDLYTQQLPKAENERMIAHLMRFGHHSIPCSFDTLISLFIKGDKAEYFKYLPYLSANDIQTLHNKMGEYFYHATDMQLYQKTIKLGERVVKLNGKKNKNQKKIDQTLHLCGEAMAATRTFEAAAWPAFMVFEYFSGFNLRMQQFEDMKTLLTPEALSGGFKSMILQRIMSAGKTVVYGTLLSLLKADGYHLAMLLPPSSLFETNAQDMLNRSRAYFGQKGHAITFKRGGKYFSLGYLRNLRCLLVNAIQNREYVMMTAESLQSMQNSYIDSLDKIARLKAAIKSYDATISTHQITAFQEKIKSIEVCKDELKEILRLIKERGAATFDEVDLTSSPKKEMNFPTDEVEHLNPLGISIVTELFLIAATDPEIKKLGLNLHQNTQARLRPSDYHAIKSILADKIISHIANSPNLRTELCLPKQYNEEMHQELIEFVTFKNIPPPQWLISMHYSTDTSENEAAEQFILIKKQLVDWLPEAWKRTADEHYGRSKEFHHIQIAKPYVAANTPNERAEISDPWETVNKTCQLYITNSLDKNQTKQMILNLCNKALLEWKANGCQMDLDQTAAVKQFTQAFKIDLLTIDCNSSVMINLIQEKLKNGSKESIQLILDFVRDSVLPEHEIFIEQITNNPQNASGAVKSFQGYSGTLENPYIFHHQIVSQEKGILPDVSSNGRVIDVLLDRNRNVHTLKSEKITAKELLKKVLDKKTPVERNRCHALIDIGVLFKGFINHTVACSILEYFNDQAGSPIEGVLYYDNEKNELAFIRKGHNKPIFLPATDPETIRSVTGLKPENIFTFYDHLHTTGSNIAQIDHATAIVSFSESVTIRDILQGVMRMRKLLDSQNVEFVIPKTIIPYLEEFLGIKIDKVTIEMLLMYGELNGFENEKEDNVRVTFQKMYDQISSFVRTSLYNEKDSDKESSLYSLTKHLFTRSLKENLFDKYGMPHTNEPTKTKLTNLREALYSQLEPALGLIDPVEWKLVKSRLDEIIHYAIKRLPTELSGTATIDALRSETVEHMQEAHKENEDEQEQEMLTQYEQQVDVGYHGPKDEKIWNKLDLQWINYPQIKEKDPSIWRLCDVLAGKQGCGNYVDCFSNNIHVTDNFICTRQTCYDLFNRNAKKNHQMLLVKDHISADYRVIFISLNEASDFKTCLKSKKFKSEDQIWLIENDGYVIAGPTDYVDFANPQLQDLLVQSQFLSGSWQTLSEPKWEPALKRVLLDKKRQMRDLFEILILDPEQRVKYRKSNFESFLNDFERNNIPKDINLANARLAVLSTAVGKIGQALNYLKKIPKESYSSNDALIKIAMEAMEPIVTCKNADVVKEGNEILSEILTGIKLNPSFIEKDFEFLADFFYDLKIDNSIRYPFIDLFKMLIKQAENHTTTLEKLIHLACYKSPDLRQVLFNYIEQLAVKKGGPKDQIIRILQDNWSLEANQLAIKIEKTKT